VHPVSGRNYRLDVPLPAPPTVLLRIVSPVSSNRLRPLFGPPNRPRDPHSIHHVGEKGRFVALPGRKKSGHRKSVAISHKMDFGGEPSPAVSESRAYSVVFSAGPVPFLSSVGPPAAERLARIVVLSTLNCSQSIWPSASSSPCSFSTIDCSVPSSALDRVRSFGEIGRIRSSRNHNAREGLAREPLSEAPKIFRSRPSGGPRRADLFHQLQEEPLRSVRIAHRSVRSGGVGPLANVRANSLATRPSYQLFVRQCLGFGDHVYSCRL